MTEQKSCPRCGGKMEAVYSYSQHPNFGTIVAWVCRVCHPYDKGAQWTVKE